MYTPQGLYTSAGLTLMFQKTSVTQELIVDDIHSFKIKPEDGGNYTQLKIRKIKKRYSFAYSTKKLQKSNWYLAVNKRC